MCDFVRDPLALVAWSERVRLEWCHQWWVRIGGQKVKGCYLCKWAEIRVVGKSYLGERSCDSVRSPKEAFDCPKSWEPPKSSWGGWPGTVAHACNSSTLAGWGEWITWANEFRDQPGQHGEALSLLKYKKLTGCGVTYLWSQLPGRLRQENHLNPVGRGCSERRLHHCTPAWATEWDPVLKKKITRKLGYFMLKG